MLCPLCEGKLQRKGCPPSTVVCAELEEKDGPQAPPITGGTTMFCPKCGRELCGEFADHPGVTCLLYDGVCKQCGIQ